MARVIEERESGTEIVTEDAAQVNRRLERALHAEGIHVIRSLNATDEVRVIVLMELGENDALFGLTLDDAEWLAGQITEAVAALREG